MIFRYILFISIFIIASTGCKQDTYKNYRIVDDNFKLIELSVFEHDQGRMTRVFSDDKYIYISNAPDFKMFVYDFKGKLIKTIGKPGPAPWENGSIWYFSKDRSNTSYWIHDYTKQLIKKFNVSNDTLITYKKIITINNVINLYGNKFLVPRLSNDNMQFYLSIFDVDSSKYLKDVNISSLLKVPISTKNINFLLHGNFCKNLNNQIIYACTNAGVFLSFDSACNDVKVIRDVRNLPIPKTYIKNGEIHLSPKQTVSLGVTCDEHVLYILATKDASKRVIKTKDFFLDMYDISDGHYLKSIRLSLYNGEEMPVYVSKNKDNLVIGYHNGTIGVYKFKSI